MNMRKYAIRPGAESGVDLNIHERKADNMRQSKTPRFQRQHYEAIAEIIRTEFRLPEQRKEIAQAFVPHFKVDNSRFQTEKFMEWATKDRK